MEGRTILITVVAGLASLLVFSFLWSQVYPSQSEKSPETSKAIGITPPTRIDPNDHNIVKQRLSEMIGMDRANQYTSDGNTKLISCSNTPENNTIVCYER